MKSYELHIYHKQGDDFGQILKHVNANRPACRPISDAIQPVMEQFGNIGLEMVNGFDNVPEALTLWASDLEVSAKQLKDLAVVFAGKRIYAKADTHHVHFEGDEETLKLAASMNLLSVFEFETEEGETLGNA